MSPVAGFVIPEEAQAAIDLTAASISNATAIQPGDRVLCINRGRKPLTDQFDGRHVTLPPGFFQIEYDAARHFQKRQIVPGTRNLEQDGYTSWIGIKGTADGRIACDTPELCVPFTDAQLEKFGEQVEAIDRSAMSNPADRDVTTIRTSAAMAATLRSTGRGGKIGVDVSAQANESATEAAEHVLDKPEESATREAEAVAAAEGIESPSRRRR